MKFKFDQLYSIKGIKWIASGIGEPMLTSRPWLDPTQMGEAKILVEVKFDKPFPQKVALKEISGRITMVDVIYLWLPSKCRIEKNIAMAADNSAPIDLDVSKNAPIIAQEASIVSGQAYISESVLKTNVQGVFSATNTPTSPLKDRRLFNLQIMYAEHTVPSSCRSGKTTKSRKEASGFATGSEANVKSLREDPEDDISTNLTTPFTDSLLRDRPVKLSTKATEMAATLHATRGRGKRGRGRRGRLG
ncbi:unnamed protein product [Brassica oleracea var. botrytis]|uniref:(rape) hypothetical protein n=1 Tax=Brassica napus TaxID=3708 RepID=A0A816U7J4_BRANA|nr:unnamed protein product [Brassica napus]